jgi:hypothetical protein
MPVWQTSPPQGWPEVAKSSLPGGVVVHHTAKGPPEDPPMVVLLQVNQLVGEDYV